MGGTLSNKERGLNREPLLHRVLGYERSDIKEVDITEFRVYIPSTRQLKVKMAGILWHSSKVIW